MFTSKQADEIIDYQQRAQEFSEGDVVVFQGGAISESGRVTKVHRGIGFVDVEFPGGNERVPVEHLIRVDENGNLSPPWTNSAPVTNTILAAQKCAVCKCSDCGCKHKEKNLVEEDPLLEDEDVNVLYMIDKSASWNKKSKKSLLEKILKTRIPSNTKISYVNRTLSTWWDQDAFSFSHIFSNPKRYKKFASLHYAFHRGAYGKKPFIASRWKKTVLASGKSIYKRYFQLDLENKKVASYVFEAKDGSYIWGLSNSETYRDKAASLKEAAKKADLLLSKCGFSLR